MSTTDATVVAPATGTPSPPKRKALDEAIGKICLKWWAGLTNFDVEKGKEGANPNRGALAELRRIGTADGPEGEEIDVSAVVGQRGFPAYLDLRRPLHGLLVGWKGTETNNHFARSHDFNAAVAVIAATLARVREHRQGSVADMLGAKAREDAPLMAEARFKRLIRTSTAPDLLDQGRRIVMLLGRAVPVDDLGASLLLWNVDPYAKRRWSFAYYAAEDLTADPPDGDHAAIAAPAITSN